MLFNGHEFKLISFMQPLSPGSITIEQTDYNSWSKKNISVDVLRLDKIHPVISGNKWFKLKYYLKDAADNHKTTLVTFGGAFSNHIVATAAAGQLSGYKTTGIIRGEKPKQLSPTLTDAAGLNMQLVFINREDYREKKIPFSLTNDMQLIPEGGQGPVGVKGAEEILDRCDKNIYTHICCATGTSTMMAGLINSSAEQQQVIGVSSMKNNKGLWNEIKKQLSKENSVRNFELLHDYHFGGYAKYEDELITFMNEFFSQTGIPLDFVYTAKLFFAIADKAKKDFFPRQSRILIVHSGGLQGNRSLPKGKLIF
jgi:1-aminocyclopropane-1-carboxylate deaminase